MPRGKKVLSKKTNGKRTRRPWPQRASDILQNAMRFAGALSNDEEVREEAQSAVAAIKPLCEFLERCDDEYRQSIGGRGAKTIVVGQTVIIRESALEKGVHAEAYRQVASEPDGTRIPLEVVGFFGNMVMLTHDEIDGRFPALKSHIEAYSEEV